MNQIVNQYSAVWMAAAFILFLILVFSQRKPTPRDLIALGVVVAGLLLAWFMLHPTQTPLMEDAANVKAMIGAGQPVLLEFQSPY